MLHAHIFFFMHPMSDNSRDVLIVVLVVLKNTQYKRQGIYMTCRIYTVDSTL